MSATCHILTISCRRGTWATLTVLHSFELWEGLGHRPTPTNQVREWLPELARFFVVRISENSIGRAAAHVVLIRSVDEPDVLAVTGDRHASELLRPGEPWWLVQVERRCRAAAADWSMGDGIATYNNGVPTDRLDPNIANRLPVLAAARRKSLTRCWLQPGSSGDHVEWAAARRCGAPR
jgi:hypothetical protein